jgi:hypothetical protein
VYTMSMMKSNEGYSAEIKQDPFNGMKYLACLNGFNTDEIPNGYSFEELNEMIDFLYKVQSEIKFRNNCANTPSIYTHSME